MHENTSEQSPALPEQPAMVINGEDELVRRIHRAVGGPAKLSMYDDPGAVRRVVLDALASTQHEQGDARRVARGDLTPAERRVVRTVTNRGAAVRSRMRQRRELARLREELRAKDARLARLEAALRTLLASVGAPGDARWTVPLQGNMPMSMAHEAVDERSMQLLMTPTYSSSPPHNALAPSEASSPDVNRSKPVTQTLLPRAHYQHTHQELQVRPLFEESTIDMSVDRDLFENIVDQVIEPISQR